MNNKHICLLVLAVLVVPMILTACGPTPAPEPTEPPKIEEPTAVPEEPTTIPEEPTAAPLEEPTATQPPATATTVPADQPVGGGTMVVTQGQNVADTLNQHISTHTYSRMAAHNVLDTLVAVNPEDGTIQPWLAKSWDVSADGKVYTFELREDVKFHDGTPFNAQAVKYNFDYTARPDITHGFAWNALGGDDYEKSEVVDDYTVEVYFKAPRPTFLINLSDGGMGIDSPTAMEEFGDDYGIKALVGTGPFKFEEFVQGDHLTLVRNEEYNWASPVFKHQGPPYLDQLIYRDVVEASTRAAALEAGELHLAALDEAQVAQFEGNPDVQVLTVPKAGTSRMYMLNNTRAPTDDIKVRQAVAHAIDKEGLLQLPAWSGLGFPGLAPLPANMMPADALATLKQYDYEYDPEKSKQLLEEAGWTVGADGIREKDGQKLVLDFINISQWVSLGEPIIDMLRQVGIQVEMQVGDIPWLLEARKSGDYHLVIGSDSGADPLRLIEYHFHSQSPSDYINYSNADEYIDKAKTAGTDSEMWEYLTLAQVQILKDAACVPGWEQLYVFGARANVHDVFFNEVGYPYYYDAWLEE